MIKEIIDDSKVILFTRPRRFGKTLNMSMIRYFFASQIPEEQTKYLFNNLKIHQEMEIFLRYIAFCGKRFAVAPEQVKS